MYANLRIASYFTSDSFLLFINNCCWSDMLFYGQVGRVIGQINIYQSNF